MRPPFGLSGFHTTHFPSSMPILSTAVLRPRCWSGRNSTLAPASSPPFWSKAHSSATSALEEVHTTPPLRPQNALMSALEFM